MADVKRFWCAHYLVDNKRNPFKLDYHPFEGISNVVMYVDIEWKTLKQIERLGDGHRNHYGFRYDVMPETIDGDDALYPLQMTWGPDGHFVPGEELDNFLRWKDQAVVILQTTQ